MYPFLQGTYVKVFAIIPAGGRGKRSGFAAPKQYLKFRGKELIVYTLEVFQNNSQVDEIVVSAEPAYFKLFNKLIKDYNLSKIKSLVEGGEERQDSVYNALKLIAADDHDLVAVHDAARPLLPHEVLTNAINVAKEKGNALVCIKARDTLMKGERTVEEYIDRKNIYYVQTPQIFPFKILKKAMKKAYEKNFIGTDESMLVKELGEEINIVEGSMFNFKVTTLTDVEMFESLIS
jgi:2-C-methyl-D-erythritol 4-phosphate cytidylyltransferase